MKREDRKKAIVCIIFFLVLWGFWAAHMINGDRLYSPWEKRALKGKPKAVLSDIVDGSYGTACEEWLTDQFPGRDWWVAVKTRCELLLGKKEIQGIYLGKDGYEFAESSQTADWDRLERDMQEQFGEEMVSRIHVPHAGAVYPEKLPSTLCFPAQEDAVFENLLEHKAEYIYYRTDHHWTMLGAYYAYEAWALEQGMEPVALDEMEKRVLKNDFLGTHYGRIHYAKQADVMEFYDPQTDCEAVYDLGKSDVTGLYQEKYLDTEDAYRYFLDGNHGLVQIETGGQGGHLVVLKDSFANCFVPFLTLHYGKITVIDPRYFRADIKEWLKGQDVAGVLILAQDTVEKTYSSMCSSP